MRFETSRIHSLPTREKRTAVSLVIGTLAVLCAAHPVFAQDASAPKPKMENVHYGPHERQVLDVYQAKSSSPTPLLFFIHGGGWMNGDKNNPDFLKKCLENGISVVSINYRLIPDATAANVWPPVQWPLQDSARALQFVRSKAAEWNIDKTRIGGCGGSAGGFNCLWLAFHADMADPKSSDAVVRESTRLCCVVAFVPQTSLDSQQMREWIPNTDYGHHAFALPSYQDFLNRREELKKWVDAYSPYVLAARDAPPVYLFYDSKPDMGKPYRDPPHSANFGAGLAAKLKSLGVEFEVNYNQWPAPADLKHPDMFLFLTEKLKGPPTAKR